MDRVFLDANVLYSAGYKATSRLRRLWRLPDVELWTSEAAVAEALGNLQQDRPAHVPELHRLISQVRFHAGTGSENALPNGVDLPAKDRRILSAAVAARATHFLTGDKSHFGRYFGRAVGGVLVLPPSEYLRTRT